MHALGSAVVTAGKDGAVAVTRLQPEGSIQGVHRYDRHHAGVAKCVRWRDAHTLASCGNDRHPPLLLFSCSPSLTCLPAQPHLSDRSSCSVSLDDQSLRVYPCCAAALALRYMPACMQQGGDRDAEAHKPCAFMG